jgi:hypothetical protein
MCTKSAAQPDRGAAGSGVRQRCSFDRDADIHDGGRSEFRNCYPRCTTTQPSSAPDTDATIAGRGARQRVESDPHP